MQKLCGWWQTENSQQQWSSSINAEVNSGALSTWVVAAKNETFKHEFDLEIVFVIYCYCSKYTTMKEYVK